MKVPYTCPPFEVISSHHCTAFGVGVFRIGRGHKNAICLHLYICQYVCIEQELKNLILWLLRGKE